MNRTRKLKQSKTGRTISALEAKNKLDELLSEVQNNYALISITQSGKPIAKLVPYLSNAFGCMKGTFKITGDIIGPEPDMWDAMDDSKSLEPVED